MGILHLRQSNLNTGSNMIIPKTRMSRIVKTLSREKFLLMLCLPVVAHLIIFSYIPMYGLLIAFRDYRLGNNFYDLSHWVGVDNFIRFFKGLYAYRLTRNTILMNVYAIIFGFPVPIIFALLLNEIRANKLKKVYQTISYLPNFISTVIICGLIVNMLSPNGGIINQLADLILGRKLDFLINAKYFRTIYVTSGIWQGFGWGSIIYLAAISGIDITLYEFADMDGASRFQKIRHITIPGILPTISVLFIMNIAGLLNLGPDKILLLYNPAIYETSDVISTYLYRVGFLGSQYSYGTAIGLMNSVVSLLLLVFFNKVAQKTNMASLW